MTFIESFHGKPDNYKLLINMEIKLYYLFDQKVCLLNLGRSDINNKKNIFFHNPSLYNLLHRENVLPFVKLKMVDGKRKPIRNQWVQF